MEAGGGPPAPATIRRYIETAEALARRVPAAADTAAQAMRRKGLEVAQHFGEVLVVDHAALPLWIRRSDTVVRAMATIAIDLFTGTAVGAVLNSVPPSPWSAPRGRGSCCPPPSGGNGSSFSACSPEPGCR